MPSFTRVVPHRRALVGGLAFAVCLHTLRLLVVGRYYSWRAAASQLTTQLPTTLWLFAGAFALGTLSVHLFLGHDLVLPAVMVLGLSMLGTVAMWHRYRSLAAAAPGPAFSALEALLFYWPGPAAVAVLFGSVERLFRRRVGASRD